MVSDHIIPRMFEFNEAALQFSCKILVEAVFQLCFLEEIDDLIKDIFIKTKIKKKKVIYPSAKQQM